MWQSSKSVDHRTLLLYRVYLGRWQRLLFRARWVSQISPGLRQPHDVVEEALDEESENLAFCFSSAVPSYCVSPGRS